VLWVTSNERLASRIAKIISETVPFKPFNHNFVMLSDFQKRGWQAPIIIGPDKERTIAKLLESKSGNSPEPAPMSFLLDARKYPFRSKTFAQTSTLAISNH
jgi:hypothetical protein